MFGTAIKRNPVTVVALFPGRVVVIATRFESTPRRAPVERSRVTVIALFQTLDFLIATGGSLEQTVGRAPVAVGSSTVVTRFVETHVAVAARCSGQPAVGVTPIFRRIVTVVALLAQVQVPVTADLTALVHDLVAVVVDTVAALLLEESDHLSGEGVASAIEVLEGPLNAGTLVWQDVPVIPNAQIAPRSGFFSSPVAKIRSGITIPSGVAGGGPHFVYYCVDIAEFARIEGGEPNRGTEGAQDRVEWVCPALRIEPAVPHRVQLSSSRRTAQFAAVSHD